MIRNPNITSETVQVNINISLDYQQILTLRGKLTRSVQTILELSLIPNITRQFFQQELELRKIFTFFILSSLKYPPTPEWAKSSVPLSVAPPSMARLYHKKKMIKDTATIWPTSDPMSWDIGDELSRTKIHIPFTGISIGYKFFGEKKYMTYVMFNSSGDNIISN